MKGSHCGQVIDADHGCDRQLIHPPASNLFHLLYQAKEFNLGSDQCLKCFVKCELSFEGDVDRHIVCEKCWMGNKSLFEQSDFVMRTAQKTTCLHCTTNEAAFTDHLCESCRREMNAFRNPYWGYRCIKCFRVCDRHEEWKPLGICCAECYPSLDDRQKSYYAQCPLLEKKCQGEENPQPGLLKTELIGVHDLLITTAQTIKDAIGGVDGQFEMMKSKIETFERENREQKSEIERLKMERENDSSRLTRLIGEADREKLSSHKQYKLDVETLEIRVEEEKEKNKALTVEVEKLRGMAVAYSAFLKAMKSLE